MAGLRKDDCERSIDSGMREADRTMPRTGPGFDGVQRPGYTGHAQDPIPAPPNPRDSREVPNSKR